MVGAATAAITVSAYADTARFNASATGDGAILSIRWADGRTGAPPEASASVVDGVLVVRFATPLDGDVSALASTAPEHFAFARRSQDGSSLRVALRQPMDVVVRTDGDARVIALSAVQNQAAAETAEGPSTEVNLGVAQRDDYTRLSFTWPQGQSTVSVTPRGDNRYELRFNRAGDVDIARLRTSPPALIRTAQRLSTPGQNLRVMITVEPGVRRRSFTDGGRAVVDFLPPEPEAQTAAAATSSDQQPGAAVASIPPARAGALTLRVQEEIGATTITAPFNQPVRAAAFQRGDAVWLVFENVNRVDLAGIVRSGRRHRDITPVLGEGVGAVRIATPPGVALTAANEGNTWTFTLSARGPGRGAANATLRRDVSFANRGRLIADFGRTGIVRWFEDPVTGERLGAALLSGPIMGVGERRATPEAAILPSRHGAAIEARAEGITADFDGTALVVGRAGGLLATGPRATSDDAALADPGMDLDALAPAGAAASGTQDSELYTRLQALQARAAAEGVEPGARVEARLALAEFLVANELAAEALGALRLAAVNQSQLEYEPSFRLLRAAANSMMGRTANAQADLNGSGLQDDPTAALWRGYALARAENWVDARRELEVGMRVLETQPPDWRARFQLELARSALALDDYETANVAGRAASAQATSREIRDRAALVLAQVALARGAQAEGLAALDRIAAGADEEVAVRAALESLKVRIASGEIALPQAAEALEGLRFRWRGDGLELDIISTLGNVYAQMGQWREGLGVMQAGADRFAREPAARRLRVDMAETFERLFLDGGADALEPIQALGLFYQFSSLTPIGPNGDRMVRQLTGRLVQVDLLQQAAELLQHQVNERLQGFARAEIAGNLAAIYLLDRRPEQALQTINATRQSNLPAVIVNERRILEARAHLDLGRYDHAVEIVERDRSPQAQRIRAEAAWRQRDWDRAGIELRRLVEGRPPGEALSDEDRQVVLRAAIAMTLAADREGVRALYRQFSGGMAGTPQATSFEVVAGDVHAEGVEIANLARAVSRTDLLDQFLQDIRTRIAAAGGVQTAQAPAQPAPNAPPSPAPPGTPTPPRAAALPPAERRG